MNYLIGNINDYYLNSDIPDSFIKNKYSITEYNLIKEGLVKFFQIHNFKIMYQDNGKPYLDTNINISISTCDDFVVVAFDKNLIGVDMEYLHEINCNQRKLLNISLEKDNLDALKEFCSKEAVIKLEGRTFKDYLLIDINKYKIDYEIFNNYLIAFAVVK